MTQFNFDEPIDRRKSDSIKWDLYKNPAIIPMWVADMDFKAPPQVIEALHARVEHGVFGYTHAPAELGEVIQARLFKQYDWKIELDWLVWLPGLVSGLNISCLAVGSDGDDVLSSVPIYPPFLTAPKLSRRNLVTAPLVDDGRKWIIDLDLIEKAITPRTRLLLLCSPQNPVGRVFSRNELEKLSEICIRHNIIICSDEIHCELVLDPDKKHIPTATLSPEVAARTITLMAPSKTFNIPGLGCSFAIIQDKKLRNNFKNSMAGIVPYINTIGYTAGLAAYRDGSDWHAALLDYLSENSKLVERTINGIPGLRMNHVEATYLAWIDTTGSGISDPRGFFERNGVGLFDGREFGTPGFLRLNFGCQKSVLEKALKRMKEAS